MTPQDSDHTVMRPGPGGSDQTLLRPTPGGRRAFAATAPPSPHSATAPAGANPLLDAAARLLALMTELRQQSSHPDVQQLHAEVVREIQAFENAARQRGARAEAILAGRYALCTALDEAVLNTPWGSESLWSAHSMLATFHKETWGGEKFFVILERVRRDPANNLDLLELMAVCLALGFQGKYRVMERGGSQVDALCEEVFNLVRQQRGGFDRALSPHWQGVDTRPDNLDRRVPLWVIAALTGALVLGVYLAFNTLLDQSAAPLLERLHSIGAPAAGQALDTGEP
ncbi:MAG TPA: DotU family type IV/VI secretion system protein [Gammaproteobacteria bacterium]|nr:DotU family type IV/VI secretion system protein [Gammaproteobacteria bacterium]